MSDSVGPLKVGVEAAVGDFAGPVRQQLQAAKREIDNFSKTQKNILGGFGESGAAEAAASKLQSAWVTAMRGPGGPLANVGGMLGTSPGRDMAYARESAQFYSSPEGRNRNLTLSMTEMAKALAAPESERAPPPAGDPLRDRGWGVAAAEREAALGPGTAWARGRGLRQFGLEGIRGLLGHVPYEFAHVLSGSPALQAVGVGAIAYHAGSEAREASIAGGKLGLTGGDYSRIERQAWWAGSASQEVVQGMKHLTEVMQTGRVGGMAGRSESQLLDRLGIRGSSTADALKKISDALEETSDPAERLRLAVRLFGEQAVETMNALEKPKGAWATSALGHTVEAGWHISEDNAARGNKAFMEDVSGLAGSLWRGAKWATGTAWQGVRTIGAGAFGTITGSLQPLRDLLDEPAREREKAEHEGAARQKAPQEAQYLARGQAMAGGQLDTPGEQLRRHVEEIQKTRGHYAPGEKKRDDLLAGRELSLAAADYAEATRPRGRLAGGFTTQSVSGASMIAEAHYQAVSQGDAMARTNTILENLLGVNKELATIARQQANFRQKPGVIEGP